MSAELITMGNRKFQGWCQECQEGINSHRRVTSEGWVDSHNDARHPDEKP